MHHNPNRKQYQQSFDLADARLFHHSDERCKEIELNAARSLRFIGPRPQMLRDLLKTMKAEEPGPAFKDRAHKTLRRIFAAMFKANERHDRFEVAATAFIDGQKETLEVYLTPDIYLRPWGEP